MSDNILSGSGDIPELTFYKVSVSPGSGKSYGLSQWLAERGPQQQFRNTVIIVPTLKLAEQTEENLRETFREACTYRHVESVHRHTHRGQVAATAVSKLTQAAPNSGLTLVMTNQGFLQVVGRLSDAAKANWQLVADEAFSVWQWTPIRLGTHPEVRYKNREHFLQMFTWSEQEDRFPQIQPRPGFAETIQAAANGDEHTAGTAALSYGELAAHVTNPATSTELVQQSDSSIEIANVIQAEAFAGFDSVTIMTADFETHPLHSFWTAQGVTFKEHRGISQYIDGDMSEAQGPYLTFGHLLPPGDEASKTNCQRDAYTGHKTTKQHPVPPERTALVVALQRFVMWAQEVDPTAEIVLATSPGINPERDVVPFIDHPAIRHAGCDLRGLNEYRGQTIMANVPCNNPTPLQTAWAMDRLGVSADRARELMRYPTIMQATGRLTRDKGCTKRKLVVTLSESDAWKQRQQHPGSTWLGQVVDLQRANRRQSGRPQATTKQSDHPEYAETRNRLRSLSNKRNRKEKQGASLSLEEQVEETQLHARMARIREETSAS